MFYLKRKMIYFVSTMLLLIGGITIYTAILSENKTIETVSLPVSNKTVVLDAGHGKPDEGEYLLH